MSPFFFVSFFLLLFALLTGSARKTYLDTHCSGKIRQECSVQRQHTEFLKEQAYFQDLNRKEKTPPSKEPTELKPPKKPKIKDKDKKRSSSSYVLKFDTHRPPNNARLNLYLVLQPPRSNDPEYRRIFTQLLHTLYAKAPFFEANLPEKIVELLLSKAEELGKFSYIDELSSLEFSDKKISALWYQMLKGEEGCPSLLHYLSFHSKPSPYQRKINLMFASAELLSTLIPEEKVLLQILRYRETLWEKIYDQEEGQEYTPPLQRSTLKKELRTFISSLFASEGIEKKREQDFDYSLSEPGNTFQYLDQNTHLLVRERHINRISSFSP